MEFAVWTRNGYFITGFAPEYEGGAHARIHVHPAVICSVPRRCGNTDVQHDNVSFCRVVCHGIRAEQRLGIHHFQIPQTEFVPFGFELIGTRFVIGKRTDIDVFKIYGDGRYVNLDVAA